MIRTASGPRSATSRDAWANRKSPVRIATVLSHRELALSAPRRLVAESITSSWYSVARWISSTTAAAVSTSSDSGRGPICAPSKVNSGRNRFPPASIRCREVSATNWYSLCTSRCSSASTRSRPVCSAPARWESPIATPATSLLVTSSAYEPAGARPAQGQRRDDAQQQGDEHTERDGGCGERPGHADGGAVGGGLAEVHEHDHAQVEERRDGARHQLDDHQRRHPVAERGREHRELRRETAGEGDARE